MRSILTPGARRRRARRLGRRWHPPQLILLGFFLAGLIGTGLLMLPIAKLGPGGTDLMTALFHAVSALCVTGLSTVDIGTYWSGFGHAVLLVLVQVGGFGIMAFASLLGLLVSRKLGLRSRLTAAAETNAEKLGGVGSLLLRVATVGLVIELICLIALTVRFAVGYHFEPMKALWYGTFHAVMAFNNAGMSLFSQGLVPFVSDVWLCSAVGLAVFLGSLGFPVLFELWRQAPRPKHWSVHTKITVGMSLLLFVGGALFITLAEWSNSRTLGALDPGSRVLAGIFHSVSIRTAGFNTIDISGLSPGTLLGMDVFMFIGGGAAGTSGGIKVTTFAVLLFAIIAEVRGDASAHAGGRSLSTRTIRQALTVALLSVAVVMIATIVLVEITSLAADRVLFEVISAFGTVGLSTGVTAQLPTAGLLIMVMLMFLGRLGPVTLISALALREDTRRFTYPEGRPLIG